MSDLDPRLVAYYSQVEADRAAAAKAVRHVRAFAGRPGRRIMDRSGRATTLCGAEPTAYDFSRVSAFAAIDKAALGVTWAAECLPLMCPVCRAVLEKKGTPS